jgi:hypothetical protein
MLPIAMPDPKEAILATPIFSKFDLKQSKA